MTHRAPMPSRPSARFVAFVLCGSALACGGPSPMAVDRAVVRGTAPQSASRVATRRDAQIEPALLDVLERYRVALKNGNLGALLELASPDYHDDMGTDSPIDDVDYHGLREFLESKLEHRVVEVQLRYDDVRWQGPRVVVRAQTRLTLALPSRAHEHVGEVQFVLERAGGSYRFLTGM